MLRYVPGFTRVESSGGEVNQNITMRGILGVEYVMFMEDGMPVFPTMHTFFMNADNLFRFDDEHRADGGGAGRQPRRCSGPIRRARSSTSSTRPAATSSPARCAATAGTEGLARYDLNAGGPLGEDWRFNVGGFYRYDHGVRDPGFPGHPGRPAQGQRDPAARQRLHPRLGQAHRRPQPVHPAAAASTNPDDPEYVPGFSNYGVHEHARRPGSPGADARPAS